ncbi:helix-turn-helix transcriptional regulator [Nocardioides insulae]|uniref:helix-turn-helix transcriptional regulator n=1 Tax=Nocardioides insulae TaxID=394734 RepID=UPI0003FCD3A2|nr:helix-turn-helix transcriptional regulator [Nocardioides insulae]
MTRAGESLMTALGFSVETGRLYERLLPESGLNLTDLSLALNLDPEDLRRQLEPLLERNVVRYDGTRVRVAVPAEVVGRLLSDTAADAAAAHHRIQEVARAMPYLAGASARPFAGLVSDVEPLDGEVTKDGPLPSIVDRLVTHSPGDLMWLRPDQWQQPWEIDMLELMAGAVEAGRRSRALYPVRILTEAPGVLAARVEAGEEVRILPELPTRMLIIGTSHAVIPEPLGYADSARCIIRQRGIVEALTMLFEQYWSRAAPVAQLERADGRPDVRRFLLEQLAEGAQDEQIARRLGVSLRTVRRRVAELMSELGAESRFQAGCEAVRRGWL